MSESALNNRFGSVPAAVTDYIEVQELVFGALHRTMLILDALPVSTTDNGTAGASGYAQIYDFPKGYIEVTGGMCKWDTVSADGTGLTTSAALEVGVGSTAVGTDTLNSLTGTTDNIVTGLGFTLSAADGTNLNGPNTATALVKLDGTTTAVDAFLNVGASAATSTADGVLTVTGTIIIDWLDFGYAGE